MTVKLKNSGWELGGAHLSWTWGQINYWDIERTRWHDVLKTYQQAGHAAVSVSVLPRVHEVGQGEYDFGPGHPQNDLGAFLAEVKEAGLKAVLWVGPRVCPGVAGAGYPEALLQDEAALARDAKGNVVLSSLGHGQEIFSLPCLVSEKLEKALRPFADKLHRVLQNWIHPDGPVIGIGLTQAPGWGPGLPAFAADYQAEAIQHYHDFLKKRYSKISHLNQVYSTDFSAFSAIHPPQTRENSGAFPEPGLLDWARFREDYFIRAAERLHALFAKLSLERIPVFLATLPSALCPANLEEIEKTRCFQYAMPEQVYETGDNLARLRIVSQNRFLVQWQQRFKTGGQPDEDYDLLCALAYGLRGWDALSPAGSGIYPGYLSTRQGAPKRPRPALWEALQESSGHEGFLNSQLYGEVGLLTLPEFERSWYLQAGTPVRLDWLGMKPAQTLGPLDEPTHEYGERFGQLEGFLSKNQFPFLIFSGEANFEKLSRLPLLLVPGMAQMSAEAQAALAQWHAKGGTIVMVGAMPGHPAKADFPVLRDLIELKPKKVSKAAGKGKTKARTAPAGRLFHLPEFDENKLLRIVQQIGVQRPLLLDHPEIRLTFHRFRTRIFVAALNPTREPIETLARREGKFVLKDLWQNNKYWGGNNEIKVSLPPKNVRFWELIPC